MRCCLFCHRQSRKKVPTQKGRTFIDYDQAEDGLCCSNCHKFSCRGCLASIYNDIVKPSGARVETDDWVRNVGKFLKGEANQQEFVGTCCFFGKSQGEEFERANPKQCLPVPTYDGWMHFPEYNLLVGDSRNATDVLAVGPMDDIRGAVHGIVPLQSAIRFAHYEIVPCGVSEPSRRKMFEMTLSDKQVSHVTCYSIQNNDVLLDIVFQSRLFSLFFFHHTIP